MIFLRSNRPGGLAAKFASKQFFLLLSAPLLFCLVLSTVISHPVITTFIHLLLALLGGNLLLCTWRNWSHLSIAVLMLHLGVLLILGGGLLGAAGYIATINIYKGEGSASAYRWDLQKDSDLGFRMLVSDIHQQYYPASVRIGILNNGKKIKLQQMHIGESFTFAQYKITAEKLNTASGNLRLKIEKDGQSRSYNTTASGQLPGSPLSFKLVAYNKPAIKKAWVDLKIYQEGKLVAQGPSAVNQPLKWQGLKFYHTQSSHDRGGREFAGIQIVNDPGIPLVYSGFFLMFCGGLLLLNKACQG